MQNTEYNVENAKNAVVVVQLIVISIVLHNMSLIIEDSYLYSDYKYYNIIIFIYYVVHVRFCLIHIYIS